MFTNIFFFKIESLVYHCFSFVLDHPSVLLSLPYYSYSKKCHDHYIWSTLKLKFKKKRHLGQLSLRKSCFAEYRWFLEI